MGAFWTAFTSWLQGVPEAWIGAFIAVVGSIVVVMATNWSNSSRLKRQLAAEAARQEKQLAAEIERQQLQQSHDLRKLEAQLRHDGAQRSEDRKAEIRREVYTKGVEEIHAFLTFIGGLPDRPLAAGNDDQVLQAFLKANAKVWLVAERDAAHLSRELTSLMSEFFFRALRAARSVRVAMQPIREIDKQLHHFEAEARRTDVKLAEAKERKDSPEIQAAIEESWRTANEIVRSLRAQQTRAMQELGPRRLACARETFDHMRDVQKAIVKLVSALRVELDLPPDEEEFLAQLADMEARAMAALDEAFGIVRNTEMA